MKLAVIGLGQCGCRVADHFARLNLKAQSERKATIAPIVIAANTDQADLSGLRFIKNDYSHRVLMGLRQTLGHGVGKINELGAQLAREDGDKILDALKSEKRFYETHAFLVVGGTAGGTGSGSLPVIVKMLKERYVNKPVYALAVLPFEHEQYSEARSVYNSATSLKSTFEVADAVFLADNQRYVKKDSSIANNMEKINRIITEPFFDMMCAGEVTKRKYVGARTVDAGDLIASFEGWTTIGIGRAELPAFRFPWEIVKSKFNDKAIESFRGSQALDAAISDMSIAVNARDAAKAIYIMSGPAKEMNMDMVKAVSDSIAEIAPNALIRGGDFPGEKHFIDLTLILSQLSVVPRIAEIYEQATRYAEQHQGQLQETHSKIQQLSEIGRELPLL
ncbi:MAG: cell division protein FtsZ [Dehalococcoidia bacterium]|nr:cell division protein FtsZ [Dehalococcoidia bacterium]